MNLDRLKMLEEFAKEDPQNPFNLYALALEYRAHDVARTRHLFDALLHDHAGYLPTYYHAGVFFIEQGEAARATEILTAGLALAQRTHDRKTAGEIGMLLDGE